MKVLVVAVLLLMPGVIFAGQWQQIDVAEMPTQLYIPETQPRLAEKRALMVSLGGCGQQAEGNTDFRDQSNWPATADEYGMVIAAPNAPGGGVMAFGCWDYYGAKHDRSNRHNDNILSLVQVLLERDDLNIDPNQVYLSGLSSGGGMVNVLLCLAPDVFAGGGNAAGPALGTTAMQIMYVATDAESVVEHCMDLAGSKSSFLATQILSLAWGDKDAIANPGYAAVTAQAFAKIYRSDATKFISQEKQAQATATKTEWSDDRGPRVSLLMIEAMGHAWPAGGGSGASPFMEANTLNYPAELTKFLFKNNRRVD